MTSARASQRRKASDETTTSSGNRTLRSADRSKAPRPMVSMRSGSTTSSKPHWLKTYGGRVSGPPVTASGPSFRR